MKNILEEIYKAGFKFLEPLTPRETYATIVKEATKLVKAQYGSILLEEHDQLKRVYSSVPPQYQITHRKRGFLYQAFKKGKPIILSSKRIEKVHPEIKQLSIVSDVIIPLSYRGKSIGILAVLTKNEKKFSDEELATLILFGSMASLAIRKTQLYDETKKALETRDFFISMAGHEMKTPVTTIFGYSQLLFNNAEKGKELKKEWINSLHAECHRLRSLINDLMETNRINSGLLHYDFHEYNLKEIVNEVVINFKLNYPERQLVFKNNLTKQNTAIVGDKNLLIQALINLLENAVKFSPSNTKISVVLKSDDPYIIIRIKDKGMGIHQKDLPKVFERYYKGVGTSHEGIGLGLFLVKSIIEHHHGSVGIRSSLNKGTTAEIKLPRIKV